MIDWDAQVLAPVMAVFGEGVPGDDTTLPLYTPRGLAPFRLPGAVFDAEYQQVEIEGEEPPSTNRRPVLGVRRALFPRDPAMNDQVMIPSTGKTYIVREPRPDGHGHVLLMLMETGS